MFRYHQSSLAIPVFLVLVSISIRSIGNSIPEHNMAEMAHASTELTPAMLGSVSFQTSCKPKVKQQFNRAVALLHSFWLDEAERSFKAVVMRDPSCAMAQWGVAMTNFNQVNGGPRPGGVAAANQALAKPGKPTSTHESPWQSVQADQ
jgi:hypothetical protein